MLFLRFPLDALLSKPFRDDKSKKVRQRPVVRLSKFLKLLFYVIWQSDCDQFHEPLIRRIPLTDNVYLEYKKYIVSQFPEL
jgi:hypothetical protein